MMLEGWGQHPHDEQILMATSVPQQAPRPSIAVDPLVSLNLQANSSVDKKRFWEDEENIMLDPTVQELLLKSS